MTTARKDRMLLEGVVEVLMRATGAQTCNTVQFENLLPSRFDCQKDSWHRETKPGFVIDR